MPDREKKLAAIASELSTCLLSIEEHHKTLVDLQKEINNAEKSLRALKSKRRWLVQRFDKFYHEEFKED